MHVNESLTGRALKMNVCHVTFLKNEAEQAPTQLSVFAALHLSLPHT